MWCLYVRRRAVRSRRVYFEQVLCRCLLVDFDAVFSVFFRMDFPFRLARQSSFLLLDGTTIFAKLRIEIAKSRKMAEKFVRTTSYRQQKYFNKNHFNKIPPQWFRAYTKEIPNVATQCQQQLSNFVKVLQKWLGTNMFVRIKSHTGSKFSRITLWQLYT